MSPGDIIHVTSAQQVADDTCIVSDNGGFIVVNPDLLISGTSVVSAVYCMRKWVVIATCVYVTLK